MFTSFRKLLVVAPLFLFAAVGFAQTSNIQGDVIGLDGKPLQGAEIKIDRTDIKASYQRQDRQERTLPLRQPADRRV